MKRSALAFFLTYSRPASAFQSICPIQRITPVRTFSIVSSPIHTLSIMDNHQAFQQATKKRITALFAKDGKNAVRDYSTKNRSKELKRLASSMDIDVPKLKTLLKKQRTNLSKVDPEKAAYIDWIMDSNKSQGESSNTNKRNRKPSMEEKKEDDDVVSTRNNSEKPKAKRVVRPKRISKEAEEQKNKVDKDEEMADVGDAVVDPSLLSDVKFEDVQMNPKTKRALTQTLKLSSMTEIQSKTFAAAASGTDVLARARTGTGESYLQ